MCTECGRMICPSSCPSFAGISAEYGRPEGRCRICRRRVYEDRSIYYGGRLYCSACGKIVKQLRDRRFKERRVNDREE